ncbi:rifin PIR protein, putative [Plasmodium reichenowi]|uniref:Rifin PIR protein, putative n=1 Tax=Plasmodium reichenowi TaxID=5854 RepID=A0A2P9DCR7_PLARE|nr:rifin PIR protein, putative [Plasmodium reichenowi]
MKVQYINILLFAVPLNILVNTHKKTHTTPSHTQTNRSLCECELYSPVNYDNYQEMKVVMENFNKQTQERFHEYDDRMVEKRKRCKDRCDKEIQNIILKDKLEKELMNKFATLQTDIQSDAIPTCVCEKSIVDKVEKTCLKCTQNLGGIVAPSSGVLAGIAEGALYAWKPLALKAAGRYAIKEGLAFGKIAGEAVGREAVIKALKTHFFIDKLGIKSVESYFTKGYFFEVEKLADVIYTKANTTCALGATKDLAKEATCTTIRNKLGMILQDGSPGPPNSSFIKKALNQLAERAKGTADYYTRAGSKKATEIITKQQISEIATTYGVWQNAITASIIAIVIIVLIMVIIYLILRGRRKKKMKKKLQYIKLLEE